MERAVTVDSILDTIGATPLIQLQRLVPANNSVILGKLEAQNPAGSIKDRIALSMIQAAEHDGHLKPGMTIIEPTSGNTGIALAMAAAALGYRLILTMPDHMSVERRAVVKSYGAEVVLTPGVQDMAGAIAKAEEIKSCDPDHTFMPQQFVNAANPRIHRETTAQEILAATDGNLDAFIAGVGTGGTISGVGRVLKEARPQIHVVAVEPARSAVLSGGEPNQHGIQGIGAGFVPQVLEREWIDEVITIEDEVALAFTRRLAREEGLLVGPSSGANVAAALQVAEDIGPQKRLVTILCDTGFRYFSVEGFGSEPETSSA